jgi:type I restriction enzyme S subunit
LPGITIQKALHRIRVRDGVDQRFLYYAFLHKGKTDGFQHLFTGSTIKHLPAEKLRQLEVGLPPLGVQVKIAERLSTLDDLIDNNRRRIKLLEDAVRLLFDEWFVRRRFPGAARVSPGELPGGWRLESLGRLTSKIGSGATPRGGEGSYVEEGTPLIRSQNVYDYGFVDDGLAFIDDDQAARLDGVTVAEHDILLNITGASVGRCCMVPSRLVPARVNQHVMIIRAAAGMDPHYLLCAINSDERKRQLLSYAQTGSTREALTKDLMSAFEVLVPDALTLGAFGQVARDVFDQREVLSAQNIKLRAARDLLLPRLMSGEVAV